MSTINKTFLRVLLAIACCIALAFSLLPQAEAAMRADVVTGKVTLNGQVIDNKNAKYPLLTYSNITYFPMTYQLSRFMGVETDWNNAAKSLNITAGGAQSAYVAETGKAQRGSVAVTPASYKISVNGAQINNKEEKYPIFNYNGITYFPLTWAYAVDSFGWSYQWDAENGLRIDTASAPARLPTDPDTGNAALDKALSNLQDSRQLPVAIQHNGTVTMVDPSEVEFVESERRKVRLHSVRGECIETYATLGQMLDMLPECFVQCHKSYLVNMACIVELRPGSVLLRSGREVSVSQRQRTSVRDSFFHYVGLNAR